MWVIDFDEVENLMPLKKPADKTRIFRSLLKGQALSYFESHVRRRMKAEDSELPENELIELVLREMYIDLEYIPKHAIHVKGITSGSQGVYIWVLMLPSNNL
jgi:hypothetical protein